jgi:hypothetical protein
MEEVRSRRVEVRGGVCSSSSLGRRPSSADELRSSLLATGGVAVCDGDIASIGEDSLRVTEVKA